MESNSKIWILSNIQQTKSIGIIIDKTVIQIGNQPFWSLLYIMSNTSVLSGIYISEEKHVIAEKKFIRSLVDKYEKHDVYTDGGSWYPGFCNVIGLKQHLHYQRKV